MLLLLLLLLAGALVLSVDSLIETTLAFLLAPLVGLIAHTLSIEAAFLSLGGAFLVVANLLLGGGWEEASHAAATAPSARASEALPAMEGIQLVDERGTNEKDATSRPAEHSEPARA